MPIAPTPLSYLNPARVDSILGADSFVPVKRPPSWLVRSLTTDQAGLCPLCNATLKLGSVDFIMPIELGGSPTDRDNRVVLCSRCARARRHRDLLHLQTDVPAALLDQRRALWSDLPHHPLPIGRGRSSDAIRHALLARAAFPRVRYICDATPDRVWIGGRAGRGMGIKIHLDVLARYAGVVREELGGVRMFGIPRALAADALAALIEVGAYLVPLSSDAEPWTVRWVGEAAHRRRAQKRGAPPMPSPARVLSTNPRAVADRASARRRRIRELIAERGEWTNRMTRVRGEPALLAELLTERDKVDQMLAALRCEAGNAS